MCPAPVSGIAALSKILMKFSITPPPASRCSRKKEEVSSDLTPSYSCGDDHNLASGAAFKRYDKKCCEAIDSFEKNWDGCMTYTSREEDQ